MPCTIRSTWIATVFANAANGLNPEHRPIISAIRVLEVGIHTTTWKCFVENAMQGSTFDTCPVAVRRERMTQRKYKSYTLWLKWIKQGWQPTITCLNLPWPAENPLFVLNTWREIFYNSSNWIRGKTWMILPEGRRPK